MRPLSPSLLAAQRDPSSAPVVRVIFSARIAETVRPRWERLWSAAEPETPHALALTSAGTMLRFRLSGGALEAQRVAEPGPGSDFGAWSSLEPAADAGIGAAASGSRALVAYAAPDGVSVRVRESLDDGATFGPATVVAAAGAPVGFVAVALRTDGDAAVFYTAGASLYAVRRAGDVWGAPGAWPRVAASVSGLSAAYGGDFDLALTGTDPAGGRRLWTCILGDGDRYPPGEWGRLVEVMAAEPDAPVSFSRPSLMVADRPRLFFVEASSAPVPYSRVLWTILAPGAFFTSDRWREPVPLDLESAEGVAVAASPAHLWLSTPARVWRAARSPESIDATDDALEVETDDGPGGGRLRVVLRNDDGRYREGEGPLAGGWEIELQAGYRTSAGEETVRWQRYWVHGWRLEAAPGRAVVTVDAQDGWSLLEGWRARRQFTWNAGDASLFEILAALLGRAGLRLVSAGGSAALGDLLPAFTVSPGVDGGTAARALLRMVPDALRFDGAEAVVSELSPAEPPSYEYGPGHAWRRFAAAGDAPAPNRVRVIGAGVLAEAFDWAEVETWYDRLLYVEDRNIGDGAQAQLRAEATLRKRALARDAGEALVLPNVGQELYDVVRFVDPASGIDVTRRVRGLSLRFRRRGRPAYELALRLGPL